MSIVDHVYDPTYPVADLAVEIQRLIDRLELTENALELASKHAQDIEFALENSGGYCKPTMINYSSGYWKETAIKEKS